MKRSARVYTERNGRSGFTLVELLVVITIIAVLATIGITVFNGVQKNARDAKRKADVDAMSKALEVHYNSALSDPYPVLVNGMFADAHIPSDPGSYEYTLPSSADSVYCVCAQLEGQSGNFASDDCGATGTAYYCRRSQQ